MSETIQSINERAIELRAQGRLREAIAIFSEGIARFPTAAVLFNNLAMTLDEIGAYKEALQAYESALMRAPTFPAALVGKGSLLLREGRIDEARAAFEEALNSEPGSVAAHLGMYELLQIKGDLVGAVEHQRQALERQRLYSHVSPHAQRSILVLCAPGDWQTNVPVDFLFDRKTSNVHKLYLTANAEGRETLPEYDVVFNAIAESDEAVPYLEAARRFIDRANKPYLNAPERVLTVGRRRLANTLAGVDATVAPIVEANRAALTEGETAFAFPIIVRPVGSHAGHDLARIDDTNGLGTYLDRVVTDAFFVSPFIDYSSSDGMFRKYRIVYVDGVPYPVHLAISPNWMIHYYNAPMAEHEWMRDEESRFLADMNVVFGGALKESIDGVATAVGLEYFGIDCTVGRDGRLLVFEADPAMLVHTTDPVELFPYKQQYVPRIYRAIEAMIDKRKNLGSL